METQLFREMCARLLKGISMKNAMRIGFSSAKQMFSLGIFATLRGKILVPTRELNAHGNFFHL